jgi:hypothetical protein
MTFFLRSFASPVGCRFFRGLPPPCFGSFLASATARYGLRPFLRARSAIFLFRSCLARFWASLGILAADYSLGMVSMVKSAVLGLI